MIVTVECPACATAFPVDPDKVPVGGARTECTVCGTEFRVDPAAWAGDEPELQEPWGGDSGEVEEASWETDARAFEETAGEEAPSAGSEPFTVESDDAVFDAFADDAVEAESDGLAFDAFADDAVEAESDGPAFDAFADDAVEAESDGLTFDAPSDDAVEAESDPFAFDTSGEETLAAASDPVEENATEDGLSVLADLDPVIPLHGGELDGAAEADPEEGVDDAGSPIASAGDSGPETGELVTDQWADLMDAEGEDEVEVSSDWGEGEGDPWIIETEEDVGAAMGGLEVERLGTVEDQVLAAQEDPGLTAPAEGLDTNQLSDPEFEGFGDFMSGQETVLPEDALEVDGAGLQLHGEEDRAGTDESVESGSADFGPNDGAETAPPEADGSATEDDDTHSTFQFGRRDPHDKARRLARVLVSDMITYNPDRHAQARQNGSVKEDFEEEIQKSWAEYVEQVGPELAESTDYWRDALNEILAGDEPLF